MEQVHGSIVIYRGSRQIGVCATEIKTGKNRIVIDFGANLPDCENDDALTDEELSDKVFGDEKCDGVLFTHYHGDHIGLYKTMPQNIPLYIDMEKKPLHIELYKEFFPDEDKEECCYSLEIPQGTYSLPAFSEKNW